MKPILTHTGRPSAGFCRKRVVVLALLMLTTLASFGQTDKNYFLNCKLGTITYTKPETQKKESTAKTVGKVLGKMLEASVGSNTEVQHHPEYADAVRAAFVAGVGRSYRFCVTDGGGEAREGGQDIVIDGDIATISTTRRVKVSVDKNKKKHESIEYTAIVNGNLTLKDAATHQVITTIPINSESYSSFWLTSADKALSYAVENVAGKITSELNRSFPLYASIVEGSTVKNDKQKEVYIDLGEYMGVQHGMHFYVYTIKTVAGREARNELGRLKVVNVMGDDISLCKVTRGGREIKTAIEAGETLLITSYD